DYFDRAIIPQINHGKDANVFLGIGPGNDFARVPTLFYTAQTHAFTLNQVVTGSTSGAHGKMVNNFQVGMLRFMWVDWTTLEGLPFAPGETITDPLGGSATFSSLDPIGPADPEDVFNAWITYKNKVRLANPNAFVFLGTLPPRVADYQVKIDDANDLLRD